jgi:hypothetical protein
LDVDGAWDSVRFSAVSMITAEFSSNGPVITDQWFEKRVSMPNKV